MNPFRTSIETNAGSSWADYGFSGTVSGKPDIAGESLSYDLIRLFSRRSPPKLLFSSLGSCISSDPFPSRLTGFELTLCFWMGEQKRFPSPDKAHLAL